MPSVTFTLIDTPSGGVAIRTDFEPAVGSPCSPAQAAALEVISRTRKEYGLSTDVVVNSTDRMVKPGGKFRRVHPGSGL